MGERRRGPPASKPGPSAAASGALPSEGGSMMRKAALYLVGFLALAAVIGYVATSGLGSMSATGPAGGGGGAAGPGGEVAGGGGTRGGAQGPRSSHGGSALPDLGAGSLGDL